MVHHPLRRFVIFALYCDGPFLTPFPPPPQTVYWEMVTKHGFDPDWYRGTGGNNAILQNVVDGLKIQPCRPSFVDARNAIILADRQNFDSFYTCDMWRAFARRGLGFSAVGTSMPITEAFDLPPNCTP